MALAAVKVVLLDTAHLDLAHRAGVFLAVGAVYLIGAYLYVRLARPEPTSTTPRRPLPRSEAPGYPQAPWRCDRSATTS